MVMKESLFEAWSRRNVYWEKRFEEPLFKKYANYGSGSDGTMSRRGKFYGAGYELYIIAFFIGLYSAKRRGLVPGEESRTFGFSISEWGHVATKGKTEKRTDYSKLIPYIFLLLIAKTDIDFIALDKGEISLRSVVDRLMETMNGYANYGLNYLLDQMEQRPDEFNGESPFFDLINNNFFQCLERFDSKKQTPQEIEPEPL